MIIVAGLGNPEPKYAKNLHNLGFMAIDKLAEKYGAEFEKNGFKAKYSVKTVNGEKVAFLKPQTYMNLSGESLREFADYFKVPPQNIIVAYDDLDIPVGRIRVRANGTSGTHNGMRNIVKELGSTDFPRVRIGSKPVAPVNILDYVLSDIKKEDADDYAFAVNLAACALDDFILGEKIENIEGKYNGAKRDA